MILVYGYGDSDVVKGLAGQALNGVEWTWFDAAYADEFPRPNEGDVLVAMGGDALAELASAGGFKKNASIASCREKPIKFTDGGHALVTYAPAIANTDLQKAGMITYDFRLARRLHDHGTVEPILGDYEWLTVDGYIELVDRYCERGTEESPLAVAFDTETMGLYPMLPGKEIVTLQLTADEGKGYALHCLQDVPKDRQRDVVAATRKLMTSPRIRIRGANLKFDFGWLWEKYDVVSTNFSMDTLIVGSLLNENRSNGLSWHSKEHTELGGYDAPLEEKYDKGEMHRVPKEDLLPYACGDVDACLRVSNVQRAELNSEPGIVRFYTKLLHPAVRAFERVERRGLLVDLERYGELEKELNQEIAEAHSGVIRMMSARCRAKHDGQLSLSRPSIISDMLFDKDVGLGLKPMKTTSRGAATDKAHLQMFKEHPEAGPIIEAYFRYTGAAKMLGTYVEGFLNHLRPNGRFHPTYMLYNGAVHESSSGGDSQGGTVTGRTSAKDPAVQTIPKHVKKGQKPWATLLRRCFVAPEGTIFFEADFSQGELRVTACVANETNMLNAYARGLDLHCVTGAGFAKMSYDDFEAAYQRMDAKDPTLDPELASLVERFRQQAKSANFGLLYGMGAEGYMIYARDSFGVHMSLMEAEVGRNSFFTTYPGLVNWHDRTRNNVKRTLRVVSPLGRVRHLPLAKSPDREARSSAERMAINSPIQSCLSDMCLWSIVHLEREYGHEGGGLHIAGMTHDSIYGYVDADKAAEILPRVTETMATLPLTETFGWENQIPFPADLKIGPSLGELKKFKPELLSMAA